MHPAQIVDLSPFVTFLLQLLTPAILAIAGWALNRVADFARVSKDSQLRALVINAVDNGISYAANKLAAEKVEISTSSQMAVAVQYVMSKIPDSLRALGLDANHVSDLVLARLPKA